MNWPFQTITIGFNNEIYDSAINSKSIIQA